jgi:hypothetical protein
VLPAEEDHATRLQVDLLTNFWTERELQKRRWAENYYD